MSSRGSYLFILPWSLTAFGGVNQVVLNLHKEMNKNGLYVPLIMVNSWRDTGIRKEKLDNIDHFFFRMRSPWNKSRKIINFIAFCLETVRVAKELNKYIKANKVKVANVHYCSLYAMNFVLLKILGIFKGHFVLSFHGKDLLLARQSRGIERILWKILLFHADKIVVCSESLKNELIDYYVLCENKTEVIHNGIDFSLFSANVTRQKDRNIEEKKFILNVATLESIKGQDVLLKAFGLVATDFPDVSLVLIGRRGGSEHQIRKLIDVLRLSQRVHLYEGLPHAQVLSYMEKAMIFVLPSRNEAFGIVILEAGACGVPVIASNVGGIPEILIHDKTGKLCASEDVHSFADELRNLLASTEVRQKLGKNLKKHVFENFSWQKTCQKYLNIVVLM